TFGGNPLVCAAAIATMETILEDGFMFDQCKRMGEYLRKELKSLQKEFPAVIADIRGMGLLVGMELTRDCSSIVKACMGKGLLLNCAAGNVLRFTPPLIVHGRDIDSMIDILDEVLNNVV
ncbi:MAG: aminotransferase class III-fold pyridoxal phosphate-dependent enzyme, partial [Nitrospirae bacterium]|nr:aminotransferase class III-fold pyridoxal phosphate-dependent enzyme [Nitrospirota bacterium]